MGRLARLYSVAASPCLDRQVRALVPGWDAVCSRLAISPDNAASSARASSAAQLSLSQLMAAGMHLGHSTAVWHKHMLPYIYGRRAGIHLINLDHSLPLLRRAINVTRDVARLGGTILFVGTRPHLRHLPADAATRCDQYFVNTQWLNGALANPALSLKHAIRHANGRSVNKPDLIVLLNTIENEQCITEATSAAIPTIALVDTDCDPLAVTYPIPGNDDSVASVGLVSSLLAEAAREGKQDRDKAILEWTLLNKHHQNNSTE